MMNLKIIFLFILFSLLMSINFATTPLPPPHYRYIVNGFVECDTIGSEANYAIQLYGFHNQYQPEYKAIQGMYFGEARAIALTDSNGYFIIVVSKEYLFDSLKVGLVQPSEPVIFSEAYYVSEDKLIEITETYSSDNGAGCKSCTTEPAETRIVRYEYYLSDTRIYLCK